VRDKVLHEAVAAVPGAALALAGGAAMGGSLMPVSDVNRQYAMSRASAAMEEGGVVPYASAATLAPAAHAALLAMGRARASYQRNAAKLCSFFARGECNRGSECPYLHEMPRERDDPLAKQAYKDGLFCKAHTPRKRVGLRLGRGCRMCFATGRDEIGLPCPACKGAGRVPNPEGPERFDLVHTDGYALHHRWL
jgi:hypothetical protein